MHGMLETDSGFTLMAADTPPGMEHNPGDNIAVSLSGDDADELRGYWEKLSDGGTVTVPAGEADVGRRVRHVRRPVRHRLDGQHRPARRADPPLAVNGQRVKHLAWSGHERGGTARSGRPGHMRGMGRDQPHVADRHPEPFSRHR